MNHSWPQTFDFFVTLRKLLLHKEAIGLCDSEFYILVFGTGCAVVSFLFYLFHFASMSHVRKSIFDIPPFEMDGWRGSPAIPAPPKRLIALAWRNFRREVSFVWYVCVTIVRLGVHVFSWPFLSAITGMAGLCLDIFQPTVQSCIALALSWSVFMTALTGRDPKGADAIDGADELEEDFENDPELPPAVGQTV